MENPPATGKSAKAYSCIRCFERKVKCDKDSPCSNCVRSNAECIFRVPPAPRRRKKRTQEEILKARVSRYEQILKDRGIDVHSDQVRVEDLPNDNNDGPETQRSTSSGTPGDDTHHAVTSAGGSAMPQRAFVAGRLIKDHGRSRFVENNLWTSVSEELRNPTDAMPDSEEEEEEDETPMMEDAAEFTLGLTPSSHGGRDPHPTANQVSILWRTFLENFNPLTKIVHQPTFQARIAEAADNPDRLPRNLEALLFAIYTGAVLTMQADECETLLGEPRTVLLYRYQLATKRALARARFLGTSDIMVLQAFVTHLLTMRGVYDPRTLWVLTGVANRIAEGMGIHRDGEALGLDPFDTEMRRRLWWQIVFLDFRTAELVGSGTVTGLGSWNTRLPLNVNDKDIYPGMKDPPTPHTRQTEMVFCLLRYEFANFWKTKLTATKAPSAEFNTLWHNFTRSCSLEEKDVGLDELEGLLESKYVQFCDPSVPVELMAMLVGRLATNSMRLMAHHPRRYPSDDAVPESERQYLWKLVMKLLEGDNTAHSSRPLRRFVWHADSYFQWQALIYVLDVLKKKPLVDQAERAWLQVAETYENHANFLDLKKPIHLAVGSLCLKAWSAREEAGAQKEFNRSTTEPEFIRKLKQGGDALRLKRRSTSASQQLDDATHTTNLSVPNQPLFADETANLNVNVDGPPAGAGVGLTPLVADNPFVHGNASSYYWWDYNNMTTSDMDFSGIPPSINDVNMDWSQWENLIKDFR